MVKHLTSESRARPIQPSGGYYTLCGVVAGAGDVHFPMWKVETSPQALSVSASTDKLVTRIEMARIEMVLEPVELCTGCKAAMVDVVLREPSGVRCPRCQSRELTYSLMWRCESCRHTWDTVRR